ncbi:hypothetical protein GE061_008540 [Apolygus lucorum]|uniref:Uncharacterized protein n=1 Tax=Apolygus lucorum TaxID=248454 RepID=A0A8S9WP22_APOLU|nr:hypothetical protein GE061_008540 [Apolygus lucorum]
MLSCVEDTKLVQPPHTVPIDIHAALTDIGVMKVLNNDFMTDGRNCAQISGDSTTSTQILVTSAEDTINELKQEITVLRIKLEKAEAAYEDECSTANLHKIEFDSEKQQLLTKLSLADAHQKEFAVRNEKLQVELRNIRIEFDDLRQEHASMSVTSPYKVLVGSSAMTNDPSINIPLSEDLKTGTSNTESDLFEKLANSAQV